MGELALGHLERTSNHGDDAVDVLIDGMQHAALRRLAHDAPDVARADQLPFVLSANITLVSLDWL